ncbi:MAG: Ni/Fe hydrogenase subunit alpha [Candidatus Hodarchaeales archaeon]|jgi:coenzyme F420-reducing hydrogenase alpha subunit
METVEISPITRIEGQAKVAVILDDQGAVSDALFHVLEFRGFEKFMEGRMIWEAPRIATRACGICPVSHHLAAVKAVEAGFDVDIPATAHLLRELMHMGQTIHSHALHFFFLAYPDYEYQIHNSPEKRNVMGLLQDKPELALKAIAIRKTGQEIIKQLGGKAIHPVSALPGGMSKGINENERQKMLKDVDSVIDVLQALLPSIFEKLDEYAALKDTFAAVETGYLGTVVDGTSNLYDGMLRFVDGSGKLTEEFPVSQYLNYIREATIPFSYVKGPYFSQLPKPKNVFQVGPLARFNVSDRLSTPLAHEAFEEFKQKFGLLAHSPLLHNQARFIELLHAAERAKELLEDQSITGSETRQKVSKKAGEGIGLLEAPRGTLIHHYKWDKDGRITLANLIVPTTFNNLAINRTVKHAAENCQGTDGKFDSSLLNLVETAIRAFDPCLTCATHLLREPGAAIDILDNSGRLIQQISRE